jgi:putative ABC transport system permease protein
MKPIRSLLRAVFRHDAMNREMNDEMRDHLSRSTERLMARGMSRADAEVAARREFGNVSVLAEDGRDARGASWVEALRGDVRYGFRSLRASPAFTTVAILSLAVGIGANTAIFSLINSVMLKPLPVYRPAELLQLSIRDSMPKDPTSPGNSYFTNPLWEGVRDATRPYATYAVSDYTGFSLVTGGEIRSARGMYVNGDFFTTLGVQPRLGRLVNAADDYPGCPATVALGEAFWQSEFGGAPGALGRTMLLEGKPFTIIGVAPRSFFGVDVGVVQQLYVPLCAEAVIRGASSALSAKSNWWLRVIARPKAGVSVAELSDRLRALSRPIMERSMPDHWDAARRAEFVSARLHVRPAFHGMSDVRARYATALKVLMGMVGLILLIACANVANLSLARGAARAREMAVRIAIGASRGRIMRQLLTEAVILAGAGTLIGVGVAAWATRFLVRLLGTSRSEVMLDLSPDLRVLAFAVTAGVLTVVLFALVPAWRATRVDPNLAMKAGGRGTAEGHNRFRIGKALVVAQSALAFVLVVGAGLLVTSFARLTSSKLGFDPEGVLIARVRLGESIPADQRRAVIDRMKSHVEAIPGVQAVSSVDIAPVSGASWNDEVVIEGDEATARKPAIVWFNAAGTGYFRTMRTRLVAGREFGPQDVPTSSKVAVINESASRMLFNRASPLGRAFRVRFKGQDGERITIVGVAEDSPYESLRESLTPLIYLAHQQSPAGSGGQLVIRAGNAMPAAIGAMKTFADATDPEMLLMFTRLEDQLSQSLQRERALAILSGFFGALALLLAMMGLYGVLAYTLARRRVEIGIRIALGAAAGRVIRLVLGDAALLVGVGILIGGAIAYAGTRVLGSLLYGVEARDPVTLLGSAVLLAAVALLAGSVPARRAASVQPVEALRED